MDLKIELPKNIYGIAIGLRFNPTFAIADNLGKISDRILYSKNSYFNPDFFPLVDSGINDVVLRDNASTRYLCVSTTDIILEVKKNSDINFDIDIFEREFKRQILESVLQAYQVRNIKRIGYLSRYKVSDKELSESFCRRSVCDINNVSIRFQKNYPMPEAMAKKDVNDYCSNIYTIVKTANSEELNIHSDYQIYFTPFLDAAEDIQYSKFLDSKNMFNKETLPELMNGYLTNK